MKKIIIFAGKEAEEVVTLSDERMQKELDKKSCYIMGMRVKWDMGIGDQTEYAQEIIESLKIEVDHGPTMILTTNDIAINFVGNMISKGVVDKGEVSLYLCSNGKTEEIKYDEEGILIDYPFGYFDIRYFDLRW